MKFPSALAIVLPSVMMMSCVTDDVLTVAPAGAEPGARPEESAAGIEYLMQAHNDYLAHVRSSGSVHSPYNCN